MMMTASTIAPMAIAMPPRLMMFAPIPWRYMMMNDISTAMGSVTIATSALRKWTRKAIATSATATDSSRSFSRSVATARSMSPERS